MKLFNSLVDSGNTVIIIEHNLDVIKQADWIIDIGPEGGKNGGKVVFQGTPKEMITTSQTLTAKSIRETTCLLYTSPSPRDYAASRMPSSA